MVGCGGGCLLGAQGVYGLEDALVAVLLGREESTWGGARWKPCVAGGARSEVGRCTRRPDGLAGVWGCATASAHACLRQAKAPAHLPLLCGALVCGQHLVGLPPLHRGSGRHRSSAAQGLHAGRKGKV